MKKKKYLSLILMAVISVLLVSGNAYASGKTVDGNADDWSENEFYNIQFENYKKAAVYESEDAYYICIITEEMHTLKHPSEWCIDFGNNIYFNFSPKRNGAYIRKGATSSLIIPTGLGGSGMVGYDGNNLCYELKFSKDSIGKMFYDTVSEWIWSAKMEDSYELASYDGLYTGIAVDGSFDDWNAITKEAVNDQYGRLEKAAVIWDDNYVYLYVEEKKGFQYQTSFTWNNIFNFRTDNGSIYPINAYSISWTYPERSLNFAEISGVSCMGTIINNGYVWEASIPIESLGVNVKYFDLLVGDRVFIGNVRDITGNHPKQENSEGGSSSVSSQNFAIDGYFKEWANISKHTIYYSEWCVNYAALHLNDEKLYGYIEMSDVAGYEVPTYFELTLNDNTVVRVGVFDRLFGTLLFEGRNTDLIVVNVENWEIIGTAAIDTSFLHYPGDRMEYSIDMNKLAKSAGLSSDNNAAMAVRTVSMYVPALGYQKVTVAGVSTGALAGVALCTIPVLLYFKRRKKHDGVDE